MFGILTRASRLGSLLRARYLSDVIFVHINKTGGTSIEQALGLRFQHKTALELRAELGRRNWKRQFSFAFVRNPWDKVASHYRYRVKTNQTDLGTHTIPFDEWVRLAYGEQNPRYYDQPKMFMPQVDWISDEKGEIMVDFVGRFERLNEDFATVCAALKREASLPHLKETTRADYRRLYTPEAAEIVGRCFSKDIAQFGYTFDDTSSRVLKKS